MVVSSWESALFGNTAQHREKRRNLEQNKLTPAEHTFDRVALDIHHRHRPIRDSHVSFVSRDHRFFTNGHLVFLSFLLSHKLTSQSILWVGNTSVSIPFRFEAGEGVLLVVRCSITLNRLSVTRNSWDPSCERHGGCLHGYPLMDMAVLWFQKPVLVYTSCYPDST